MPGMRQSPRLPPLDSEQLYSDLQSMQASGDFPGKGPALANHPLNALTGPNETWRTGACQ